MGILADIQAGVLERFLVTPVRKIALIFGDLLYLAILQLCQFFIIFLLAYILGVRLNIGFFEFLLFLCVPLIFGSAVGSLSIGMALFTRKHEMMISVMQFFSMPLMFLSSAYIPQEMMPDWIRLAGRYNPVDWAVQAGRAVLSGQAGGGKWILYAGAVLVFAIIGVGVCLSAFRAYRRSL